MRALIFMMIFFIVGCRSTKKITETRSDHKEVVKEHIVSYKDTILFTKKQSTSLRFSVNDLIEIKDSLKTSFKGFKNQSFTNKNGRAIVRFKIKHDTIYVTADCNRDSIAAKIKKELRTKTVNQQQIHIKNTKQKRGYTFIDLMMYSIGFLIVGFIGGFTIKN